MKTLILKLLLPGWLLEMAQQVAMQPSRCTAHPFWQVRCKRFVVTEEGYNDHHFILCDDDGEFFRSDQDECVNSKLLYRYPEFCEDWEKITGENFLEMYNYDYDDLPDMVDKIYVQEIEEVVSTHLTEHDAKWFIKRKQHDYPPLYTWVESAYWSPQFKQLQDWLKSLAN